jgi:hypothetical protein
MTTSPSEPDGAWNELDDILERKARAVKQGRPITKTEAEWLDMAPGDNDPSTTLLRKYYQLKAQDRAARLKVEDRSCLLCGEEDCDHVPDEVLGFLIDNPHYEYQDTKTK